MPNLTAMNNRIKKISKDNSELSAQINDTNAAAGQVLTSDGAGGASYKLPVDTDVLGNTVIGLGTSITCGNVTALTNIGTRSHFEWAVKLSQGKLIRIANAGVSGNTIAQIYARTQADVIAKAPKICVLEAGANDTATGSLGSYEDIVKLLMNNNIIPVLCTILPHTTNYANVVKMNFGIRNLAHKYKLSLADYYNLAVDLTTGKYKAEYDSGDNIHPNSVCSKALGQLLFDTISSKIIAPAVFLPACNDTYNAALNGFFLTDTNADGLADNWTKSGAGAYTSSIVTGDTNIVGNWQSIEKTVNDANAVTIQGNSINTTGTGFSAGDKIAVCFRLKTTGIESGSGKYRIRLLMSAGATRPFFGGVGGTGGNGFSMDFDGVIYDEFVLPASNALMFIQFEILEGTGKIEFAQVGIYNLTLAGGL